MLPHRPQASSSPDSSSVVMFDKTTEQAFNGSNFTATGRDHISLNFHLVTGGASLPYPLTPSGQVEDCGSQAPRVLTPQRDQPPPNSLLARVRRKLRNHSQGQPYSHIHSRTTNRISLLSNPVTPPSVPPPLSQTGSPTSAHDLTLFPDGSSVSSFDIRSQVSLSRPYVSSDEEVYERSLLPKGQGYPLFEPQPFGKPAKYGDFGILSRDGFQAFGNLYNIDDQANFSLECPPTHTVTLQPEKLAEGQVLSTGIEEVARLAGAGSDAMNSFTFLCRKNHGAVLALPSAAELETLAPKSRNHLRDYLCRHGSGLVSQLRRERYLEAGQSLYVVTGTIKSSSWGIAVHTSPMQEPHDQLILSRRQATQGPTHEWTRRGEAYARCRSSAVIDDSGQRMKDQALFLRGFLLTPSSDLERKVGARGDLSAGDSGSNSEATDPEGPGKSWKGGGSGSGRQQGGPSRGISQGYGDSKTSQLQDHPDLPCLVEHFPAQSPNPKRHYPSQCVNETILENEHAELAITHDDDWRHIVAQGYLDDEALCSLMANLWRTKTSTVQHQAATTLPRPSYFPTPPFNNEHLEAASDNIPPHTIQRNPEPNDRPAPTLPPMPEVSHSRAKKKASVDMQGSPSFQGDPQGSQDPLALPWSNPPPQISPTNGLQMQGMGQQLYQPPENTEGVNVRPFDPIGGPFAHSLGSSAGPSLPGRSIATWQLLTPDSQELTHRNEDKIPEGNPKDDHQAKQRKHRLGCTECRRLKIRCEGNTKGESCKRCISNGYDCIFPVIRRRTRPERRHPIKESNEQSEATGPPMQQAEMSNEDWVMIAETGKDAEGLDSWVLADTTTVPTPFTLHMQRMRTGSASPTAL